MNDQPVRRRQRHLAMLALRTMAPKAGGMGCWAGMSSPNASRGAVPWLKYTRTSRGLCRCLQTMSDMDWKEAIRQWRALPEAEKRRRRWANIPRSVAQSFAFEGEPVDLAMLEAEHARRPMPPASAPPGAGRRTGKR